MKSKRWLIEGRLRACTNLRVGSGGTTNRENLFVEGQAGEVDVSACAVDINGRAYLPGTTIKGRLRSLAERLQLETTQDLFGSPDPKAEDSVGGKIIFFDSHIAHDSTSLTAAEAQNLPHWSQKRHTAVSAGVTINRQTRTAADQRLFHQEFVPCGTSFHLRLAGVEMVENEVIELLRLLEYFNLKHDGAGLGASISDSWGRFQWKLTSLKTLDDDQLLNWITESMDRGSARAGWNVLQEVPPATMNVLHEKAKAQVTRDLSSAVVTTTIQLHFESNFLVNDPSRSKPRRKNQLEKSPEPSSNDLPNHTPLLTKEGRVLLPASSIRGALRSQAERILRTIGGAKSACYPDGNACKAVAEINDLRQLCPACKLFGAPGWRSPIQLSSFTPTAEGEGHVVEKQEFVAIDRFTGGGAPQLKFNATSRYQPILKGQLSIDLARLAYADAGGWAIALLVLVLRDLVEGDIRLGFGSAKGFGALHAKIFNLRIHDWDSIPSLYTEDLKIDRIAMEELVWPGITPDDLIFKIAEWIEDLVSVCNKQNSNF